MLLTHHCAHAVFQFVSAAYGVGSTDAIMNNLILQKVPVYMPGETGADVLGVGAAGLESAFSGDRLRGARLAYLSGLRGSWAMAIAMFGVTFLCALVPARGGKLVRSVDGASGSDEKGNEAAAVPVMG